MGQDFTSYSYPTYTEFTDKGGDEDHSEPASEQFRSSVQDAEHPLFSPKGLKETLNLNRRLSNSVTEFIEKDIDPKVIEGAIKSAQKSNVPYELLVFAMDFEKKLDEQSSDGGAEKAAKNIKKYADELSKSLGRTPLNSEILMAVATEDASKVKKIIEDARDKPNEEASKLGSKHDKIIMEKPKFDKTAKRTNKEIVQFFKNRMGVGSKVFPHTID